MDNERRIYPDASDTRVATSGTWKTIISWVVITTFGWALMLALVIAAFWLLG